MTIIGEAFVAVRPDTQGFGAETEKGVLSSVSSIAKKAAAIMGGALVVKKGFDFLGDAVGEARESNKVAAQTAAVIQSTGAAAHVTAKDVDALSAAISRKTGIDDEQIAKASNLLLTFTNVRNEVGKGNDIFNQATSIAADMGAALGTDAAGSAIQLGKALNDPVKGIVALTRVGVTFSAEQKKQIEGFQKAGKVTDAQKVILRELNKEFGGSAAAQATATDKLKVTVGNIKEQIGNKLVPVIDTVASFLADKLPAAMDVADRVLGRLSDVLGPIIEKGQQLITALFTGDFHGGPFAEDSPVVDVVFRIRDALGDLLDIARKVGQDVGPLLSSALSTITPALADAVGNVASKVGDFLGYLASPDGETALRIIEGVVAAVVALKVAEATAGTVNGLIGKVTGLKDAALNATTETRKLVEQLGKVVSKTADLAVTGADKAASAAKSVADQLAKIVSKSITVSAKTSIDVQDAAKKGLSLAGSLAAGFAGGIGSFVATTFGPAIGSAISGALAAAGAAIAAAAAALGISVAALVGAAIAAAIALVLVVVFREKIVGFFQRLPGYIASALSALPHLLGEVFGTAVAAGLLVIFGIPALIVRALIAGVPAVAGAAGRIGGAIFSGIGDVLSGLPGLIANVASGLVGALGGALSAIATGLAALPGLVASAFGGLVSFLTQLPGIIASGLASLPGLLAQLPGVAARAVAGMLDALGQLALNMPALAGKAAGGFVSAIAALPGQVADIFGGILDFLSHPPFADVVGKLFGAIADGFRDGWRRVNELTGGALNDLLRIIGAIPGQLLGFVGRLADAGKDMGLAIIRGLGQGISNAVSFVGDIASAIGRAIKSVVNTQIIDRINNALEFTIKGPGFLPDIHLNPPDIPHLATGGVALATRGGTLARLAEAGRPELVLPLPPGLLTGLTALAALAREGGLGRSLQVIMQAPPERDAGREVIAELIAAEQLGLV